MNSYTDLKLLFGDIHNHCGISYAHGSLEDALNNATPVAAVSALLGGQGTAPEVMEAVIKSLDPLNPGSINIEELMSTANAIVKANVPSIQANYRELRQRGVDNLADAGMRSIFSDKMDRTIEDLSGFGAFSGGAVVPADLPPGTTPNPDGTFTLPDGTIVRKTKGAQ